MLASASPRRKELLGLTGLSFDTWSTDVDETPYINEDPRAFCQRLSIEKARAAHASHPDALIIAADTIVALKDRILGKPVDAAQASVFLNLLKNETHAVMTAYTLLEPAADKTITRVVATTVKFRDMTAAEIDWYVASGEPLDKAGAYAIQGMGGLFIERIDGSHSNVIGLPLAELYADLQSFGIKLTQTK